MKYLFKFNSVKQEFKDTSKSHNNSPSHLLGDAHESMRENGQLNSVQFGCDISQRKIPSDLL